MNTAQSNIYQKYDLVMSSTKNYFQKSDNLSYVIKDSLIKWNKIIPKFLHKHKVKEIYVVLTYFYLKQRTYMKFPIHIKLEILLRII